MSNIVQGMVWNIDFPNPLAKIIALKLADNANDEGGDIFPSIKTICDRTGCSRAIVYKWITALEYPGVLKVVHRSAGGSQKDRTERAFDMELLRRLARPSRKTPPALVLRVASIEREATRDDGSPLLFDGAIKLVRITVFEIEPFARPVCQKDGSPVRDKDGSPVRQKDGSSARPVRQKDATRPPHGRDPSATRTRTVSQSVNERDQNRPTLPIEGEAIGDSGPSCDDRQSGAEAPQTSPFGDGLLPCSMVMDPLWQAIDIAKRRCPDPIGGKRLPFAASALVALGRMCVDREKLIERYFEKTAGKRIKNPSGYLVRMALEEVAKRDGVSVELAQRLYSEDAATRAQAQAEAMGVHAPEPPKPAKTPTRSDARALQESLQRLGGAIQRRGAA